MKDRIENSADQTLIRRSQEGDAAAFDLLIKKYEQKIYNLLLRMTANETEANDLFQETFISAWRNIRQFKAKSNFSTWLYRIAVNAVFMMHRKKKLATVSLDAPVKTSEDDIKRELSIDWSDNPLATLENAELKERLNHAIELLPDQYRTVLLLSDMQGLSNDEIKNILNISLASVKSRLHRARLFLRERLSEYFKPQ